MLLFSPMYGSVIVIGGLSRLLGLSCAIRSLWCSFGGAVDDVVLIVVVVDDDVVGVVDFLL